MPAKIELELLGSHPNNLSEHARALQALIYNWVAAADTNAARVLHDELDLKPIVIEPLNSTDTERIALRLSILDDSYTYRLCQGIQARGSSIQLKSKAHLYRYQISPDIKIKNYPWDDFTNRAKPGVAWHIDLLSPTTCRKNRHTLPLPIPQNYIMSWYYKWERFSPKRIGFQKEEFLEFVSNRVDVTSMSGHINEHQIAPKERGWPAFIGFVDYRIASPTMEDKKFLFAIDTLALFSNICGTGAQGMRGMGLTLTTRRQLIDGTKASLGTT